MYPQPFSDPYRLIIGERQEYEFCTILEEHIPYSRHYKLLILDPKIEEFPCLVHKLSVQTSTSKVHIF